MTSGRRRNEEVSIVCFCVFKLRARLDIFLRERALSEMLIANRLIAPGSEKHAHEWMMERSGMKDLLGFQDDIGSCGVCVDELGLL